MKYRLGLDMGTNSLGWVVYELDRNNHITSIIDAGARIYTDGRDAKSGESLAADRRAARAARRRRDRFLRRRDVLMEELIRLGLMPSDEQQRKVLEALEPYELRAQALDTPLPAHHIGRAIFHLNQRRGFKSNRKADRKNDEKGKINTGIAELVHAMEDQNARTYGEFLYKRVSAGETARARLNDAGDAYPFYPARHLLEEEFDAIWQAQKPHHPALLTDEAYKRLHDIMFYQRPLKEPVVGQCSFIAGEQRLPKAHPLFQQRRLYEEVNALEIARTGETPRKLTAEERDNLIRKLRVKKKITFESLAKALKLPQGAHFNKESDNRKDLAGDEVFAEMAHTSRFSNRWNHFKWEEQWRIVERVRDEENPEVLLNWLKENYDLDDETAQAVADARLPDGHGRFGITATKAILRELKADDVPVYSKAVERAPELPHHSDHRDGEVWDKLPYYGQVLERYILPGTNDPNEADDAVRYGRITNPTVHIGLGQLRRVINALIAKYGHPSQIVLELARDLKLNDKQKKTVNAKIRENTLAAQQRSKILEEHGQVDNGRNRLMLRLWEELNPKNPLDRRCPYCGEQISIDMLFSAATDIDHILPYSETLDDSPSNKTVCHSHCNRQKRNRAPYDAFGGDGERWAQISDIAARLQNNKRWRFSPDAMHRFDAIGGFLARQLAETQHLAKLSREYLTKVCPDGVWVVPGQLTEMIRRHWGLNTLLHDHNVYDVTKKKNRNDHRHHIIDAAVVGATDRSLLQKISREAGRREHEGLEEVIGSIPYPWDGFRDDLRDKLEKVIISHRPDHGSLKPGSTSGRLHNDTAYGLTGEKDERGNDLVVHRVPLSSLKSAKDIMKIRDTHLRDLLWGETRDLSGKDFEAALHRFAKSDKANGYCGLRRIRIIEPLNVIAIKDKNGRAYKGYKGDANYRYDVWRMPDGKWQADVITRFEAHQPDFNPQNRRPHPAAKKVLSLQQGDLIAIEEDGVRKIMRIVKFDQSGSIYFAQHNEANVDARTRDKLDSYNMTKKAASRLATLKARKVRVDDIGVLTDSGFRQ